jgi:hypothetical protein
MFFIDSISIHIFYADNYHSNIFCVIARILFISKLNNFHIITLNKENQLPSRIKYEKFVQTWKNHTNIKIKQDVHTNIKIK